MERLKLFEQKHSHSLTLSRLCPIDWWSCFVASLFEFCIRLSFCQPTLLFLLTVMKSWTKIKWLQMYPLLCFSTGNSGEGPGHHRLRKQWSGLRPPIRTSRLSCRVKRKKLFLHHYLKIWPFIYQHSMVSQLPYHIYLTQMFSVHICVFVLSQCYLRGTEEESSVGFLIRETPKLFIILSSGSLPLTLSDTLM